MIRITLYNNAWRLTDDGNYDYSHQVTARIVEVWVIRGKITRAKVEGDLVLIMTETHVYKILLDEYSNGVQNKLINLLYPLL